ncbi:extracellular solute-binding protein [Rhizobium miluonense]|uniref:Multiple sugar transport system substrate-binding protein n=1 Tax=Rhizobium miluonense TaxID=411945 RepID=A0A1C3X0E5_9HYPH|nr:extracellular solute-binding protein [Rhizobium miluonense]SCB45464.1 multiple sugar transport system substrate-binding protein [Rhizobium miluonense]
MMFSRRNFMKAGAATSAALAIPAISHAAGKTTVTLTQGVQTYQALLAELAAEFEAANPSMAVKFVADGENWDPLLNNTIRAAVVNALPDGSWQSLTYAGILASRKIAQPLNEMFGGDVKALEALGLSSTMVDATSVSGQVYCLPYGTTVPIVYCNMDLLRKAGYQKPQPPASWQEIFEVGKQVAALGGGINGGYIEYTSTNAWMFQNLLNSFGGKMMNDSRTDIAFDGAGGRQALETLYRFGDILKTDMTQEQSRQAFKAGATAMHIQSASGTASTAKAVAGHFELAISQFPVESTNGRLAGAGHGFFMFTKDPAKQRVVWEFMKFATSQKGQIILAKNSGYMPINIAALKDPGFLDAYLKINPYHRGIVDRLAITGDQFSFPSDNTVKIVQMMADEMHDVVTQRAKPDAVLAQMASQTRKLLG